MPQEHQIPWEEIQPEPEDIELQEELNKLLDLSETFDKSETIHEGVSNKGKLERMRKATQDDLDSFEARRKRYLNRICPAEIKKPNKRSSGEKRKYQYF